MTETTSDFLIEIGTEEIPASYIKPAAEQFASELIQLLDEKKISYKKLSSAYTPKRLVVLAEGVAPKAQDCIDEYVGPAVSAGKSPDGKFLPPAIGFAQKYGLSPAELKVKTLPKGDYFVAVIKTTGEKTQKILEKELPSIISRIKFPKSMVWEETQFRFARPIRNILAFYGTKSLKVNLAGVKSSKTTFGLGPGFSKKITIKSATGYFDTLRNHCIFVNYEERKKHLLRALEMAVKSLKLESLQLIYDEELLDEVTNLIEHPVAVVGSFDEKYLKLPQEILITCMKRKQKFFALKKNGKIVNHFIAVKNGISSNIENIRLGYEKVLVARLEDALFFFNNDIKSSFDRWIEKLKDVIFNEKLGNMYQKVLRVVSLSKYLAERLNIPEDERKNIERAAMLSKADLVSEVVFEYPELSGVAGRIYSDKKGEPQKIIEIIEQHYWPSTSDGQLPKTLSGGVVAVADKMDTLTGNFSIGFIPTGSEDPYGLKKQAIGILRIFEHYNIEIPLAEVIEKSLDLYPEILEGKRESVKDELLSFFRQRLETTLEGYGYRYDEIRAVLAAGFENIPDVLRRISALKKIRSDPQFEHIAIIFKRASNIIKQFRKLSPTTTLCAVKEEKFKEPEEAELFTALNNLEINLKTLLSKNDYAGAFKMLVGIGEKLDRFFDNVLVMTPQEDIKLNRLSLLSKILNLYLPIADISHISQE